MSRCAASRDHAVLEKPAQVSICPKRLGETSYLNWLDGLVECLGIVKFVELVYVFHYKLQSNSNLFYKTNQPN